MYRYLLAALMFCTPIAVVTASSASASPAGLQQLLREFEGSSSERGIVSRVLNVVERECPELRRLIKASVQHDNKRKTPFWQLGVNDASNVWFSSAPYSKLFGWKRFVSLYIPLKNAGTISISMGGGKLPGISSRTGAKYLGVDICNLDDGLGEYTFRKVPELKFIDALK